MGRVFCTSDHSEDVLTLLVPGICPHHHVFAYTRVCILSVEEGTTGLTPKNSPFSQEPKKMGLSPPTPHMENVHSFVTFSYGWLPSVQWKSAVDTEEAEIGPKDNAS